MTEKQDYGAKPMIDGIIIKDLKTFWQEDGSFTELMRFGAGAQSFIDIPDNLQINLSLIQPGAIKAYHRHERQFDVWACWEPLLVRLYDGRLDSPTFNMSMRFTLCNQILYICPGVSHGVANLTQAPIHLLYAVNQFFNPEDPDEIREPWDMLDSPENSLWEMQRQ